MSLNEFDAAQEKYVEEDFSDVIVPVKQPQAAAEPVSTELAEEDFSGVINAEKEYKVDSLKNSIFVNKNTEPAEAYKYVELANKLDLPADFVGRNYDELKSTGEEPDYENLVSRSPVTAEFLTDPENASVLRNQIPQLQKVESSINEYNGVERLIRNLGAGTLKLGAGYSQAPAYMYEVFRNTSAQGKFFGAITGAPEKAPDWLLKNPVAQVLNETADSLKSLEVDEDMLAHAQAGNYEKAGAALVMKASYSAPSTLAFIAASFATAPLALPAATAFTFLSGAGQAIASTADRDDLSQTQRLTQATLNPMIEALTERYLGVPRVFRKVAANIAAKFGNQARASFLTGIASSIGFAALQEGPIEEGTSALGQAIVDYATDVDPNAFDNIGSKLFEGSMVGALTGGVMSGPAAYYKAKHSQIYKDFYRAFGTDAEALEIREKLPAKFKQYIEKQTKGTSVENVFINAEVFREYFDRLGIDPAAEANRIGAGVEYSRALEAGDDIKIPMSQWASYVGTEHWAPLENDVKRNQKELSVNEAKEVLEDQKKLEEEALNAYEMATEEEKKSAEIIGQRVQEETKGTPLEQHSDKFARLEMGRLIARTRARGKGETPEQVYEADKAGFGDGAVLNQGDVIDAKNRFKKESSAEYKLSLEGKEAEVINPLSLQVAKEVNDSKKEAELGSDEFKSWLTRKLGDAPFEMYSEEDKSKIVDSYAKYKDNQKRFFDWAMNKYGEKWLEFSDSEIEKIGKEFDENQRKFFQDNLGSFDPLTNKIDLSKANFSTYLHELSHRWTFELINDAFTEGTPDKLRADLDTVLEWMGVDARTKDGKDAVTSALKREHFEKFALGAETYFKEGKAPSSALVELFESIKQYMLDVYKTFRESGVKFTPEVEEVMNRLLVVNEGVAQVHSQLPSLFQEGKSVGMTDDDAAEYEKARLSVSSQAKGILNREVLKAFVDRQTKEVVVRRKELIEKLIPIIKQFKNYSAIDVILNGFIGADGKKQFMRIDRESYIAEYGEESYKKLLEKYGKKLFSTTQGVHLDTVAQMSGYDTSAELNYDLQTSMDFDEFVERTADNQIKEEIPDVLEMPEFTDDIISAYHNENRTRLLNLEMKLLIQKSKGTANEIDRRLISRINRMQNMRAAARAEIGKLSASEISTYKYYQLEKRHAKAASKAYVSNDISKAFEHKVKEYEAHEHYLAAVEALETVHKQAKAITRFAKEDRQMELGKAGGDFLNVMNTILAMYQFRNTLDKPPTNLREWVTERRKRIEEKDSGEFMMDIPEVMINRGEQINYQYVPISEVNDVYETVLSLWNIAKKENEITGIEGYEQLEALVADIVTEIETNQPIRKPLTREPGRPDNKQIKVKDDFIGSHRKLSNIIKQMSGWKEGGLLWEVFVRPQNHSGNTEAKMISDASVQLSKIVAMFSKTERLAVGLGKRRVYDGGLYRPEVIPGVKQPLSKMAQIVIALHYGHKEGRERLSHEFTPTDIRNILNNLNERDIKVVKEIYKVVGQYWEELNALNKRVTGIDLIKVESVSYVTKHGIVEGGFFPMGYIDEKAQEDAAEKEATLAVNGGRYKKSTKSGSRNARLESVDRPLDLSFDQIFKHISDTVHDITHYETVSRLNRILGHEKVATAIKERHGDGVYKQIKSEIRDLAGGDIVPSNPLASFLMSATARGAMGYNFVTSALQITGLGQSLYLVGVKHMAEAASKYIKNPKLSHNSIHSKSKLMPIRALTMNREIAESQSSLVRKGIFNIEDLHLFAMIVRMQSYVDDLTWLAAYHKHIEKNPISDKLNLEQQEKLAIDLADQTVLDSQGGGQTKDLAKIQRDKGVWKVLTLFYSYMNTTFNLNYEIASKANKVKWHNTLASFIAVNTIPIAMTLAIKNTIQSAIGGDDDDDEPFWKELAKAHGAFLFGQVVGLRELEGLFENRSYSGPAAFRPIVNVSKKAQQASKAISDEEYIDALMTAATIPLDFSGLPMVQAKRTAKGAYSIYEGESSNPLRLLFGIPKGENK